ncbi:MAG: sulfite exporter TauE/SafE family protein [Patescibacteria group bacterium]
MKTHYQIAGMHCKSCEILVAQHLRKIPGVDGVRVNHSTGVATIEHQGRAPDRSRISTAVRDAGYTLGTAGRRPFISRDSSEWFEVLFAACIVFVLFIFSKLFGVFDLVSKAGTGTGPATALLVGLTAGVSSCMALVGGLILGISARHAELHPEASTAQKFRPHLFFNLGRLISFAVLGGVIGSVGAIARPSGGFLGMLIIIAGIVMFMLGIKLLEVFPRASSGLTLPSSIARMLGIDRETREYSHRGAIITGALTFFMPCGFTQAMQIYAVSTGSFLQGSIVMTLFALGTMPGLLGIGALSSAVRGAGARLFFKCAGIVVIVLGLWNISNGWNLTGIVLSRPAPSGVVQQPGKNTTVAVVRDGAQYMAMDQWAGGYKPNRFTVKKGIPVVWTVNSTDSYTCASSLVIPSLGIARSLTPGTNIIEFTPAQTGFIKFSCSMGMYTGLIEVIN